MNNQELPSIHRNDLYEEIWKIPAERLAKKYGITGRGLSKICTKLKIPTPPRGYWARRQHGWHVVQKRLPKLKKGDPDTYTLKSDMPKKENETLSEFSDEAIAMILAESEPENKIVVPDKIGSPHKLVGNTITFYNNNLKGIKVEYGTTKFLNVGFSSDVRDRALRTMDTLIKTLINRGFDVDVDGSYATKIYVLIFGEKIYFTLKEKLKQVKGRQTAFHKKYNITPNKWENIPTGELRLRIEDYWFRNYSRRTWADAPRQKVENQLNSFIVGLIKIADTEKRESLRRREEYRREKLELEERLRLEAIEHERLEAIRKAKEQEEARRKELEQQAEVWIKSNQIRSFIDAAELAVDQNQMSIDEREKFREWSEWAKEHADRIDPLKSEIGVLLKRIKNIT